MRVTLGRTGLSVNQDGFGGLPLQRASYEDAMAIMQAALAGGIDFFDTARVYSDSEEKLGAVLRNAPRESFVIATKSMSDTPEGIRADLDESLRLLGLDTIDIYQLHNPKTCPLPGDGSGLYEVLEEARAAGKIRYIGITNHRIDVARAAVESGAYDTLQFPFCYLSGPEEEALVARCAEKDVGFIAMKALSGGLLNHLPTARAWMAQHPNVVPIWGIQRMSELEELLALQRQPAGGLTETQKQRIQQDRAELGSEFCRGCGYCMPCPEDIAISMCARMSLLLKRAPAAGYLTPAWQQEMAKIENCTRCGQCAARCPYGLVPYELLEKNHREYQTHF